MAKTKILKPVGCTVLAAVCMLTAVNVATFSAHAATDGYEGYAYELETKSRQDSLNKANELSKELAGEGFTLLKNEDGVLPLGNGAKVSLFGKNWENPVYGGSGSSSFSTASEGVVSAYKSMEDAGFKINPSLRAFYKDNARSGNGRPNYSYGTTDMATGETPMASYDNEAKKDFGAYKDAAVVMLSRTGGEGYDVTHTYNAASIDGRATTAGQHYLMLDDNEKALINLARETVGANGKVVVLVNSSSPLEFADAEYSKIDSILWTGLPGTTGFDALGKILKGDINPSGRTIDTWGKDFKKIPAVQNFGNNGVSAKYENDNSSSGALISPAGNALLLPTEDDDGNVTYTAPGNTVVYEEGIYVGYKYYETRAYEEDKNTGAVADKWYNDNVLYPFGYGLSYTTFSYSEFALSGEITKDGTVTATVKVTNTGNKAGKEVVQLYYSAPYTAGKIEKSHVELGDFAKTGLLNAGDSEVVTLSIPVKSMASYDWDDANGNGYKCYELDAGDYNFYVGGNSHSWYNNTANKGKLNLAAGITYEMDVDCKADKNDNQFDDVSKGIEGRGITEMSRNDFEGTFPQPLSEEDRSVGVPTSNYLRTQNWKVNTLADPDASEYDKGKPWYVAAADMPKYAETELTGKEEGIIRLMDLKGIDPWNDDGTENEQWKKFLDQFTLKQMTEMVEFGKFRSIAIDALGIPEGIHPDGPFGFVGQEPNHGSARCYYVSPNIVAATFNKELMEKQGAMIGEEGAWMGYNGLYGPGVNIHRTPFSGRNFEYYSEDAFLTGITAAYVTKGMQSKGVFPFLKHFALNDQETDRNGVSTFATEQAMREIYLKAFQLAIDVDSTSNVWSADYNGHKGALGIMSAFNRVGYEWAGSNYALLTTVLREEWGFKGFVVTDWFNGGYMDQTRMIRAGNDLSLAMTQQITPLVNNKDIGAANVYTATTVTALRNAARNISYATLWSCNMSKLVNYTDTVELNDNYTLFKGKELTLDFASDVYGNQFTGLTYEITPSDTQTIHHTNPKPLPADLPNGYAKINGSVATVNIPADAKVNEDGTATWQLTVSVKNANGKYLGQSKTVTINYIDKTVDEQVSALTEAVNDLASKLDKLTSDLGTANGTISNLQTTINGLQTTITSLQNDIKTLQSANTEANGKLAELETALEAANTALEAAKKEASDGDAALKAELEELKKALEEANAKIADLEKASAEGGCGSSVALGSTMALVSVALAGAVIMLVLKKRTNK